MLENTLLSPIIPLNTAPCFVRIAYFITIKDNPELFLDLFKKLYNINQLYLIYIDHNCPFAIKNKIQTHITHFSNTYILDSFDIFTDSNYEFEIDLKAIQFLLNVSSKWDFFINLNDNHYPLKSQYRICEFLSTNKDNNFISYYHDKQFDFSNLTSYLSLELNQKTLKSYFGTKWMILTRDTCCFLSYSQQVDRFIKFYHNNNLNLESFFQMVLLNSDYKKVIINNDKRIFYSKKESTESLLQHLKSNNNLFINNLDSPLDNTLTRYIENTFLSPILP